MSSPDSSLDPFESYEWDPYDDIGQPQTSTKDLKLCQLPDWDSEATYNDEPPIYIHYSIVWKVTRNKRAVVGPDTVQDTVLAPSSFCQHFIQSKIDNYWREKKDKPVRSEDTNVVVSVTQRKEDDLILRFTDTSFDWAVIEKQLLAWGKFYRAGKKLTLKLSFNYVDSSQLSTIAKRGFPSTTLQMLAEGAAQDDAEQASSGHPPAWRHVYNLMRCPGPPCNKGPYCWRDPIGKKHYKLNTRHLKSLVMYVQDGYILETHDDVKKEFREELYAEEQQSLERHQRASKTSTSSLPPVNITNVLPALSGQAYHLASSSGTPAPDLPSKPAQIGRLDIGGFLDDQVGEYCSWLQSRVKEPKLKVEYQKARDVIIEDGMDLELIRRDPNPKFLTDQGIKRGAAEHVVGDIDYWVEKVKRSRTAE